MDQVLEISVENEKAVEDQQVVELSLDMLDKIGGGVVVLTL